MCKHSREFLKKVKRPKKHKNKDRNYKEVVKVEEKKK